MSKSQFHYGMIQIKLSEIINPINPLCLNSTMVWFKWEMGFCGGFGVCLSQFHYGMIQIKVTDKEIELLKQWSQFHYGMIQMQLLRLLQWLQFLVSIPLWYDSNKQKSILIAVRNASLNSTMVWFKSLHLNNRLW